MNSADHKRKREEASWEHVGRAAESFARRVARDAGKFAERLEEHAGEFARDVSHEWRHVRRRYARVVRGASADDVRRVLDDVRDVLADIVDGVDELISGVFGSREAHPAPSDSAVSEWARIVSNREVTCTACGRTVQPGEEGFSRHGADGLTFRCLQCGEANPAASRV
jgi:predicted RNA-binding Zn-ribbon protein involved in translation (DUF1610 family)